MDASMPGRLPSALLRCAAALLVVACVGEAASSAASVAAPGTAPGDTEDQKLSIDDHAAEDIYGAAVALHGDLAVVACEYDDDLGKDSGSVHVFRDDGGRWVHEQKLLAADGQAGDNFGRSVAVQGELIVVGAHWDDDKGNNAGSAYVFRHDGERWVQEQKLLARDGQAQDRFGVSVSLDGDVIGISAWLADGAGRDSGAVYVFRHDGERWAQEQKLTAADASRFASFGRSVSVSGTRLVAGAWKDSGAGTDAGAAYVFRHDGGRWVQEQKLVAAEAAAGDRFGWCVWLDGTVALVGGWKADASADRRGAAWVFRHDGERWVQEQRLAASDATEGDGFGFSTVVQGDSALVGAPRAQTEVGRSGAAYVFRREDGRWVQTRKLISSNAGGGDSFGFQAAMHAGRVLVGAWRTSQAGKQTGSAYAYRAP
jgi:hypothetical protein